MLNYGLLAENPLSRQAMTLLMDSEVLPQMRAQLLEALASGDASESDEIMVKRLREYRTDLTVIDSLIDAGESIKRKENEDEPR